MSPLIAVLSVTWVVIAIIVSINWLLLRAALKDEGE
jgi:hypothetical protein